MSEKSHITTRGKHVRAVALAGTLSLAGYGAATLVPGAVRNVAAAGHDLAHPSTWASDPTPHIPTGTPYETVTVAHANEGADEVISQVEPKALDSVSAETELENIIDAQGHAANHQLEFGQTVRVPIIDPSSRNSARH
jgi:hypothetical protein